MTIYLQCSELLEFLEFLLNNLEILFNLEFNKALNSFLQVLSFILILSDVCFTKIVNFPLKSVLNREIV